MRRFALAPALALAALPAVADVDFEPRIMLSSTYVDNINLSPSGGEVDEIVWQVVPSFTLRQNAQRVQSSIDYSMQNLLFTDESDRNETFHQLDATSTLALVRDMLFLDIGAGITQVLVDPEGPSNPENLFDVGNTTDARTARIRPYIDRLAGPVRIGASYARARVDYEPISGLGIITEDTDNSEASASLESADEDGTLTWSLEYDEVETDYETSLDYLFETAQAELGWAVSRKLRLLASGGAETDLAVDTDSGGLDSSFWQVGFRWQPNPRNLVEVRGGERFFGNTYNVIWRREARLLTLDVSYFEEPTTVSQVTAFGEPAFPDPTTPGTTPQPPFVEPPPPPVRTDFRLTPEVYVRRNLQSAIALNGRRTQFELALFGEERTYVETDLEERSNGVNMTLRRQMGVRLNAGANATFTRTELRAGEEFDDRQTSLFTDLRLGPRSTLSAIATRLDRAGALNEYTVHTVRLQWARVF